MPSAGAWGGTVPLRMHRLCPLSPAHLGSPVFSLHGQTSPGCPPPSHLCSPRASPLLAAVPHVSGCTRSSPACPVHRNADLFAQHPPFAHLHARKGVKSPRPGTALQAVRETRSPPKKTQGGHPDPAGPWAAVTPKVALVLGTLCPGWPQGGSGHLCPQDCPAGLGCQQGSTPGCRHCRDPHGPNGTGRMPRGGRGATVPTGRGMRSPRVRGYNPRR